MRVGCIVRSKIKHKPGILRKIVHWWPRQKESDAFAFIRESKECYARGRRFRGLKSRLERLWHKALHRDVETSLGEFVVYIF